MDVSTLFVTGSALWPADGIYSPPLPDEEPSLLVSSRYVTTLTPSLAKVLSVLTIIHRQSSPAFDTSRWVPPSHFNACSALLPSKAEPPSSYLLNQTLGSGEFSRPLSDSNPLNWVLGYLGRSKEQQLRASRSVGSWHKLCGECGLSGQLSGPSLFGRFQ